MDFDAHAEALAINRPAEPHVRARCAPIGACAPGERERSAKVADGVLHDVIRARDTADGATMRIDREDGRHMRWDQRQRGRHRRVECACSLTTLADRRFVFVVMGDV